MFCVCNNNPGLAAISGCWPSVLMYFQFPAWMHPLTAFNACSDRRCFFYEHEAPLRSVLKYTKQQKKKTF